LESEHGEQWRWGHQKKLQLHLVRLPKPLEIKNLDVYPDLPLAHSLILCKMPIKSLTFLPC